METAKIRGSIYLAKVEAAFTRSFLLLWKVERALCFSGRIVAAQKRVPKCMIGCRSKLQPEGK